MTTFNVHKRTAQYVQLRDTIKAMEKKHEEEIKPYKDMLHELNGLLMQHLDSQNVEAMKTEVGTVYVYARSSASVADPDAFMKFVIETEDWDLIERRANVTACKAFLDERIEANKADPTLQVSLPPGVNLSTIRQVGVRRA